MRTGLGAVREHWREVLTAGGRTGVPRWTLEAGSAIGDHETPVPRGLAAALRLLAEQLRVPLSSVLLAAHAKVLAALSGETEVCTGYVAEPGGAPLPCRLSTGSGTWRELIEHTAGIDAQTFAFRDFPVDELRAELGISAPPFETVFDPTGTDGDLAGDTVLRLDVSPDLEMLRLCFRTEVLDSEAAERILGYHLSALTQIRTDVTASHRETTLLSAAELKLQLEGLAGPHVEVPDLRCHELFQRNVARNPDAIAAVHGDRKWTYRELNGRANRLARALIARGLRREGVVAVVTERNLDWMAAVLAVFKAGGVYLPIEPHFPTDRIATTLRRADCELVLTEPGSTTTLRKAVESLPGVRTLFVDAAYEENHSEDDLGVAVESGQLAYIYFTSGSTGEPKGAMCEHAGMVNHLYAKINDLGITAESVVAQVAPQCFDISLWQLVSALLVGGTTLLIEQDVILDADRFVGKLGSGGVSVLQVVPSYLEVVLSAVDKNPVALPDLRCVSVTGEALKTELAQRWFATMPDVKLVNAYGLTETSDDTNHEVMDRAPTRERVPLGPPVQNVRVYVVDERLDPVPLGAPGEIVFSGVCVGRGYVNDPERTARAFTADPHRPDARLYRSGDHGRWLPEGKLEFLGRRDAQVKIRGFRIEIGEIENTLLQVPGVRDGAVVVADRGGQGKRLVAFYSSPDQLDHELMREHLGTALPEYMLPAAFHWREQLPLTANGKIDKKNLAALAAELDVADEDRDQPVTGTEERLAAAWADVLGIRAGQVGRRDHFFDRGGTSLSAVKLAIALDRAVSIKDVAKHPVLADLAALIDSRSPASGNS
ncbi:MULTISPECIES: amino acid adenylation domain-containing protein [unclassified Amycolatopsis]|uniref:non-ribosomal peptide synthetase n=1 Tax=unclassified Amycolatopsis TaxID=2618356 RepID=UPI001EE90E6A|nr:amino acid adenylation domain-containing protein [Amycolatopsis sp. Poz14]MCG3753038.1 amino acid adenylation domain-containing protein [Amycolatopsis sp. Poz14]